jgi:hypothetical protein
MLARYDMMGRAAQLGRGGDSGLTSRLTRPALLGDHLWLLLLLGLPCREP